MILIQIIFSILWRLLLSIDKENKYNTNIKVYVSANFKRYIRMYDIFFCSINPYVFQ